MPTYQYACTACGEKLEAVQSFTDAALTECPACSGDLRKVYSAVGVVFKGSGFYKNDSRKSTSDAGQKKTDAGKGDGNKGGNKGDSGGSGEGTTKSEPKAEPKTDPKPAAAKSDSGASRASTPASKTA